MRKVLAFRREYGRSILLGKKTTTVRLRSNLREGEVVDVKVGDVHVGRAYIENVVTKRVRELSDADALNDGFRSKEDLILELKKIYGGGRITDDTEVKVIRFRLLGL
ncbi:MAG: ASCH domain-containing protein [Zestosphaera sp.]